MRLKISIITVNLNNNEGLKETLQSVKQQPFKSYEHIIIDGDSIDGSKETILQYAHNNSHVSFWASEKDNGVFSAMNKGITKAQGEYLLFLNSGDYLNEDVLTQADKKISGEDVIFGDLHIISNNNRRLQTFPDPPFRASQIIGRDFYIPHPASFIKRSLLADNGYNEQYKILSDGEFFLRCFLKNCTFKHINIPISNFKEGGISNNPKNRAQMEEERINLFHNLLPTIILDDLNELATIKNSPLYNTLYQKKYNKKVQKRINQLIKICYKIYCLFTINAASKRKI